MIATDNPSRSASRKRKMIVTGAVAILLCHFVVHIAREQMHAAEVRRLGGSVRYQCGLVHRIYFQSGSPFKDDDLGALLAFRDLTELDLTRTRVTSEGVARLRNCRRLGLLEVRKDQITDEQEQVMMSGEHPIEVAKYKVASDGMRIADGYE